VGGDVKTKILQAIQTAGTITYDQLAARAVKRGMSLDELDELMAKVQKDKRVKSVVKNGVINYTWTTPKPVAPRTPHSHLTWLRQNYPRMTPETDGSGIEADYSYMFLTPEEKKQYDADCKGMPIHMLKKLARRA